MDNTPIDKDFYRYDANHRFAAMYPLPARIGVPEATVQADGYGVWVTLRKPVSSETVAE